MQFDCGRFILMGCCAAVSRPTPRSQLCGPICVSASGWLNMQRPYPAYAKGADADEPAAASRRLGHNRRDRHADHSAAIDVSADVFETSRHRTLTSDFAICEAAQRPTMRFVAVKSEDKQSSVMIFKARDLLVRQRTQTINALREGLSH
jgi:hypothetical protein